MLKRYTPLKRHTPPKKISDKQQRRIKKYSLDKAPFLEQHPECMIKRPGCKIVSSQVHHTKGKIGELLFAQEYWVATCDGPCHSWAEAHPSEAKAMGISVDRLTK